MFYRIMFLNGIERIYYGTEQLRKLGNVLFYLDEFKPYLESSYADGM